MFATNIKEHSVICKNEKEKIGKAKKKKNTYRSKKSENTNICWCQIGYYKTSNNFA